MYNDVHNYNSTIQTRIQQTVMLVIVQKINSDIGYDNIILYLHICSNLIQ